MPVQHSTSHHGGSHASPWLAFLIGGLIVAVAAIVWFLSSGAALTPTNTVDIQVESPNLPTIPEAPDLPKLPDAPKAPGSPMQ